MTIQYSTERYPISKVETCTHFGMCGGCSFQNLSYISQLDYKQQIIYKLFDDLNVINLPYIQPSQKITQYRNKMEFVFAQKNNKLLLGLRKRKYFNEVINISTCVLCSKWINDLLNEFRFWIEKKYNYNPLYKPYDLITHKGSVRYLVVKESKSFDYAVVYLMTTSQIDLEIFFNEVKDFSKYLLRFYPKLKGVSIVVNDNPSDTAEVSQSQKIKTIFGQNYIEEKIKNYIFTYNIKTFFQTNPLTFQLLCIFLYEYIYDFYEVLIDLYSGCGVFGILLHKYALHGFLIEKNIAAAKDAKENIKKNNVKNLEVICSDCVKFLNQKTLDYLKGKKILAIIDPPREGIHPKLLNKIKILKPKTIIYLSCNPNTLKTDITALNTIYEVRLLKGFDFFPHTQHIEILTHLELK